MQHKLDAFQVLHRQEAGDTHRHSLSRSIYLFRHIPQRKSWYLAVHKPLATRLYLFRLMLNVELDDRDPCRGIAQRFESGQRTLNLNSVATHSRYAAATSLFAS